MKKSRLIKEHLKATKRLAYKRIARLESWLDGVKEDRQDTLDEMTAEYAKIEMANKLLAIMKEYRKES
jgi:hypothetical protein